MCCSWCLSMSVMIPVWAAAPGTGAAAIPGGSAVAVENRLLYLGCCPQCSRGLKGWESWREISLVWAPCVGEAGPLNGPCALKCFPFLCLSCGKSRRAGL